MSDIEVWAEAMSRLDEETLFSLFRLYLGEIKTPYNKQRLIERLAGFIMKPQNLQRAVLLLDPFDAQVLSAIYLIPEATENKLSEFFEGSCTYSELYSELMNLRQRLLIYRDSSESSPFKITPMLLDELKPYLGAGNLLCVEENARPVYEDAFCISPDFLAAFIAYIKINGISCRADGEIKKKDLERAQSVFGSHTEAFKLLLKAFLALSLACEKDGRIIANNARINAFAELPDYQQYALLCAACFAGFGTEGRRREAQLLLDVMASVPAGGYTRSSILRLAYLLGASSGGSGALGSRFSQLMAQASGEGTNLSAQNVSLMDRLLDAALVLGLFYKSGETASGEPVFMPGKLGSQDYDGTVPKVLSIEATFSVNLMPGLRLCDLLPLTDFLAVKKLAFISEFEVTRQSVSRAFDASLVPQDIFERLEKISYYELPQNVRENIEEWYSSYSSVILYRGYVIRVSEKNENILMRNASLKRFIKEKLAPGVYFLNIPDNTDARFFIEESGLDFMGSVRLAEESSAYTRFPALAEGRSAFDGEVGTKGPVYTAAGAVAFLNELRQEVDSMDLQDFQRDNLKSLVSDRVILSREQLLNSEIRMEILDAGGMDYDGKLHLLDASIKAQDLVQLQLPSAKTQGEYFTLIGLPLSLTHQQSDAVLRFRIEPTKEVTNFAVSRLTHVKRLKV